MGHWKHIEEYFLLLLFILALVLSFIIVRQMINAVIIAAVLAYIFYPVNKRIEKISSRNLAPMITLLAVLALVIAPLALAANSVATQAVSFFSQAQGIQNLQDCYSNNCSRLFQFISRAEVSTALQSFYFAMQKYVLETSKKVLLSLPSKILEFAVIVLLFYYFLRDGKKLLADSVKCLPLSAKHIKVLCDKVSSLSSAIVYGSVLVSVLQGIIIAITFWLLGVKGFFIWGMLAMLAAFIPYIGTPVVWLPVSISLIASGFASHNSLIVGKGVVIILVGVFLVGLIDNILKPHLIGNKTGLHPVVTLIGVIGGIQAFGAIGIFIGPLALAMLMTCMHLLKE